MFENRASRNVQTKYYVPYYDRKNFFDQSIKNDLKTYNNFRKVGTGQGGDYTTGCLLYYTYFQERCKLILIDLSKQQKLNADPTAIQEINFTGK